MFRDLSPVEIGVFTLMTAWFGYNLYSGIRHGVIYHKRGSASREESPASFWFLMILYTLFLGGIGAAVLGVF